MRIPSAIIDMLLLVPENIRGEVATAILARLVNLRAADHGQPSVSNLDADLSVAAALHFSPIGQHLDAHHRALLMRRQNYAARQQRNTSDNRPIVETLNETEEVVLTPQNIDAIATDEAISERQLINALDKATRRIRLSHGNMLLDQLRKRLYGCKQYMIDAISINPLITVAEYIQRLSLYRHEMNPLPITIPQPTPRRRSISLFESPADLNFYARIDRIERLHRQTLQLALDNAPKPQQISFKQYLRKNFHISPQLTIHKILRSRLP